MIAVVLRLNVYFSRLLLLTFYREGNVDKSASGIAFSVVSVVNRMLMLSFASTDLVHGPPLHVTHVWVEVEAENEMKKQWNEADDVTLNDH